MWALSRVAVSYHYKTVRFGCFTGRVWDHISRKLDVVSIWGQFYALDMYLDSDPSKNLKKLQSAFFVIWILVKKSVCFRSDIGQTESDPVEFLSDGLFERPGCQISVHTSYRHDLKHLVNYGGAQGVLCGSRNQRRGFWPKSDMSDR